MRTIIGRAPVRAAIGCLIPVVAVLVIALLVAGCRGGTRADAWSSPNADLAGTRAVTGGEIDVGTVRELRPRWRFPLAGKPGYSGIFASTPVALDGTVYVQDLRSDVYALDGDTGRLKWERRFDAPNDGPNGLAVEEDRVYGATDSDAFALSARDGAVLWTRHLTNREEQFVDVAPVAWHGLVFLGTVGYPPFGRGAIYALDADTGSVMWKFVTVKEPWPHPFEAGGGGLWYPVSIDEHGLLYAGTTNPAPWGGSPRFPNGGAFPGPVLYSDSLVVLDARTGTLAWHDQVTPHDIRDYDFQATPVLARVEGRDLVFGAGKGGRVIAWDRSTHRRVWTAEVGLHQNDTGPLPRRRVPVCPGLLGGVETPMAYAAGRIYVPVVDLCGWGSAVGRQNVTTVDPTKGRGRLVALDAATGRTVWERRLPLPDFGCASVSNGIVVTATFDGTIYAFGAEDGTELWRTHARAGVNACPAIVGDLLVVGAGVPRPDGVTEVIAYGADDGE